MKRNTINHPKILELAAFLKSKKAAVGMCEMLWHFTAVYAIQGNVGKHSDETIANAIDWNGEPREIIDVLVACRLLERHDPPLRLYVHDWHDHADDSVSKALSRNGLNYALGDIPRTRLKNGEEKITIKSPSETLREFAAKQDDHMPDGASKTGFGEKEQEFMGDEKYKETLLALRSTKKIPQLTYEHVAQVGSEYPMAQIERKDNYDQIVLELKGVAGTISTVLPWLRKAVSGLEKRNTDEATQKFMSENNPRDRRFVPDGA